MLCTLYAAQMDPVDSDVVRVGKCVVAMDTARGWVTAYTDAERNTVSPTPFAYPAYDLYNASDNDPGVLTDADLLAPGLLNVSVKIRTYYGLQGMRGFLEPLLQHPELATPLADLTDERIAFHVGGLYSVLDAKPRPSGVRGTLLSKVLHRKRPASLALHDAWVQACYLGEGAPVPLSKRRTWADYMVLVSQAMAKDIRDQPQQFSELHKASKAGPRLTDLRLLDIIAWHAGQGRTAS